MKTMKKYLLWLLVPLILAGCGAADPGDAGADAVDETPPQIEQVQPANGAILEPDQIQIRVTFSEAIDPTSLDGALSVALNNAPLAGQWHLSDDGRSVQFTPDAPYPLDALITVSVAPSITDLAGNPLPSGRSWSFRTPRTHRLSIRVQGLTTAGATLTVQERESGQRLVLQQNGTQAFPERLRQGTAFRLALDSQLPAGVELDCALEYSEGTLQGDTTVTLYCSPVVPLYPNHGADWNDYLAADGSGPLDAQDQACNGGPRGACLHGGELRRYRLPAGLVADCNGISARDDLEAFRWTCFTDDDGAVIVASLGLAEDKGLADLIDFDRPAWRVNQVRIFKDGTQIAASGEGVWWHNPVRRPGGVILTESGTVYTIDAQTPTRKFLLSNVSRVAWVTAPGLTVQAPDTDPVLNVNNSSFLWLEGRIDGRDQAQYGIEGYNVFHSVLHRLEVFAAAGNGISLQVPSTAAPTGLLLRHVRSHGNGGDGLVLSGDGALLTGVRSEGNGGHGLRLITADDNRLLDLRAAGNGGHGLYLRQSRGNRLQHLALYANQGDGLRLEVGLDNLVQDLLVAANDGAGIRFSAIGAVTSRNNLLRQVTAVRNADGGLRFDDGDDSHRDNRILALAAAGNTPEDLVLGAGPNPFADGQVGSCSGGTCPTGVSAGLDLSAFFGPVAQDDAVNGDDSDGMAFANYISDWSGFENDYRAWGLPGAAGACTGIRQCQIHDWSAAAAGPLLGRLPLPSGDDLLTHTWSDNGQSTALAHALESSGDGDGLCESDERCLHTPNVGAYPGHGQLQTVPFTDGAIRGVTLQHYDQNGR